ncbi:MAG: pyrroline-5-carboxylate reductase [Clostridiales bacterium]|nr:pyrroline-5-carboxylate reductase [Clostridiales bacterium]
MDKKIGFIGNGNMASAIYKGMLSSGLSMPENIIVSALDPNKLEKKAKEIGFVAAKSNREVVEKSDIIFLAVKPQYLGDVMVDIRPAVNASKAFISIVAGWTNVKLKASLGNEGRVLRVMPNTPLLVGEGMSCLCAENDLTEEEFIYIQSVFAQMGQVEVLEEKHIAIFSGVAGSSPAYTYMYIEALADAACKWGLPRHIGYRVVAQAVLGAAKMVLETKEHPGALKDAVCSPAGTTIVAVQALEDRGFRAAVMDCVDRCTEKFNQL